EENVRVWDVASGKGLAQTGSAPLVRQMEFSPDNRFLISGGADGMARIWEVSSGRLVAELRHGPALTHAVNQVAFSPERRQEILVAGADNTARVWAGITDNKGWIWTGFKAATPVLRHSDRVTLASFSSDGRFVLTACADGTVRLWDLATGRLGSPLMEHDDTV